MKGTLPHRMAELDVAKAGFWSRVFARYYDMVLNVSEEAGLSTIRGGVLANANGRVLELGAGTGLNLSHYPEAVEALVLTEPDPNMLKKLRRKVAVQNQDRFVEITSGDAGNLPFPDDSFDTVVSTLVLCTVPDPVKAIAEAHRVLKPGGQLLFVEHVLGEGAVAARQKAIAGPWEKIACGCRCDRPTHATLEASDLMVVEMTHGRMPKATKFLKPLIHGRAVKNAAGVGS